MIKVLIIDLSPTKNSLWKNEFVYPITKLIKNISNYTIIHFTDLKKTNLETFEKIILSGSPLNDFKAINKIELFHWIKDTNKPILGICAGFQIINKIFEEKLNLKKLQEIGLIEIKIEKKNILFSNNLKVYCLHNKGISKNQKIENFEILATSKICIEAIKHKKKDIYGVLFHPEVSNNEIILNFIKN